jgi:hypothetical protein
VSGEGLHELLVRLRQHLHGGAQLDAETRQHLTALTNDLERSLAAGGGTARQATAPRLESLAVRFEASHPGLAETLRDLIDALGKAGI